MTHTCPVPDVCKTPSPGGPVPIPYVNVAMDSDIADGAETVKIEGNPIANVAAKIATSSGDEAGSAGGGIMSSKIKGTVTWKKGSLDVKAEGKSVVRFLETNFHNGNAFNTTGPAPGEGDMSYADDFTGKCKICGKDPVDHRIVETESSAATCAKIVEELLEQFRAAPFDRKEGYAKVERNEFGQFVRWRGYMVGVMACKNDAPHGAPHLFAAMSGTYILPGFREVAQNNGCQVIGGGGPGAGGKLRAMDFVSANASGVLKRTVRDVVNAAWKNAKTRASVGDPLYSKPGICAGAHLVAKSGHGPKEMTEMFFGAGAPWPKTYNFRVDNVIRPADFGPDVAVTTSTPWGQTVGSCQTCQDLLYTAMCPVKKCKPK